jgi:hypothetical protein
MEGTANHQRNECLGATSLPAKFQKFFKTLLAKVNGWGEGGAGEDLVAIWGRALTVLCLGPGQDPGLPLAFRT